ncbi:hypothetical protein NQ292_27655, partial [Escherichia coli]|nr:hypothetical protein [Escherichia coli]
AILGGVGITVAKFSHEICCLWIAARIKSGIEAKSVSIWGSFGDIDGGRTGGASTQKKAIKTPPSRQLRDPRL